jgi:hypothetical protein
LAAGTRTPPETVAAQDRKPETMTMQNDFETDLPSNRSQLVTILVLFVTLRLTVLLLYTPRGLLNAYTDSFYFFRTALLSENGFLPFINMWYEYPPLSAYLVQIAYCVSNNVLPVGPDIEVGFRFFSVVLGAILLLFDTGILVFIHRISMKLWGVEQANLSGWVYMGLGLPLFYWSFAHNNISVFFMLLALDLFLEDKTAASAIATGFGIVSKLVPIIFLAPVAKFIEGEKIKRMFLYSLLTLAVIAFAYLPFVLMGSSEWVLASFKAWGKISSWSTIWAMLDGNWGPGNYGELINRTELSKAGISYGHLSVIPEVIKSGFFAIVYAWLWLRKIPQRNPRLIVFFTTLTVMVFHLWSKGWSPQWSTLIIPFILITFPGKRGIYLSLLLALLVFIEWPISDILKNQVILSVSILARTVLFLGIGIWCARAIWNSPGKTLTQLAPKQAK